MDFKKERPKGIKIYIYTFETSISLHQGSSLSPALFSLTFIYRGIYGKGSNRRDSSRQDDYNFGLLWMIKSIDGEEGGRNGKSN